MLKAILLRIYPAIDLFLAIPDTILLRIYPAVDLFLATQQTAFAIRPRHPS